MSKWERATLILAALVCLFSTTIAQAQLRPIVIQNARLANPGSPTVDQVSIKISGGKIEAVAKEVETGFLTKKIDASGKIVTPGFIDCWSCLGLVPGEAHAPSTQARARDAFDHYAKAPMIDALAHGVTTAFIAPPPATGFSGTGSVLRVTPWGSIEDRTLVSESALCVCVGVAGNPGPITRVKEAAALDKMFEEAKAYRKSLDTYEEDLEEYEKKIKERLEKEAEQKESEEGEKKQEGDQKAAEEDKPKENGDKDEKDKEDELKKPAEPARNPQHQTLLRVLDGELTLRIEAHRPEDILNALRTATKYNIRPILVGASGGHLVAKQIAEAKVPVLLGQTVRTARFENNEHRYHSPDNAAILRKAGVEVYITGGGQPANTKLLAFNTALATGHGLDEDIAFQSITTAAAKLLGVDDRIGRVAPGMEADLVIWSADPFSPDAKVETVLVGGTIVHEASKDWRFGASN